MLSDTQNLSKDPSLLFQIANNNLDFYLIRKIQLEDYLDLRELEKKIQSHRM